MTASIVTRCCEESVRFMFDACACVLCCDEPT